MKNVWLIFKEDLMHLATNMIAAIVVVGLVFVPPMYAWLTTLGFWNPYGQTNGVRVAVANQDQGYSSNLLPTKVNAGDQIVAALHENNGFDWEFMDKDQALESVKSGECYAAVIIPQDFTKQLASVFGPDAQRAKIEYVINQKSNAIASHVTSQGASELQAQIDDTFSKTVADVALSTTSDMAEFADGNGVAQYGRLLDEQIGESAADLRATSDQLRSFGQLAGLASTLAASDGETLAGIEQASQGALGLSDDAKRELEDGALALSEAEDGLSTGLAQARSGLEGVQEAANKAFDALESAPDDAAPTLTDLAADSRLAADDCSDLREELERLDVGQTAIDALGNASAALGRLASTLDQAAQSAAQAGSDASAARETTRQQIEQARTDLEGASDALDGDVRTKATALSESLSRLDDRMQSLGTDLQTTAHDLDDAARSLGSNMTQLQDSLQKGATVLDDAASQLETTQERLKEALSAGDFEQVRKIVGNNADAIAGFLSAPTELVKHAVYEMPNNGSSMSSFYSSLSLWIGAIFLVALAQVNVSRRRIASLHNPRPWELYLGRYGAFCLIGLLQALVLCVGNVFFVGVECQHFWLYLLACCITSVVFTNLVYTLTISFGNVGKAVAIVLLVMQLAGTGGIMPVQMSAPIFQDISPWLPFTHSIEAMSGCLAGIYGNQYAMALAMLAAFLAPSLLLGLVLRRPMVHANDYITEKLDQTKLI